MSAHLRIFQFLESCRPLSYSGDSAASRLRVALMKGDSVAQLEEVLGWLPVLLYHGQRDLLVPLRGTAHMVSGGRLAGGKGVF